MSVSNGNQIQVGCVEPDCGDVIAISIFEIEESHRIRCSSCKKEYIFNSQLVGQIKKFERLVSAIQDAKDILGQTAVAVDIQGHSVKIPYKLLLTRLNSQLKLKINEQEMTIKFRVEPLEEKVLR